MFIAISTDLAVCGVYLEALLYGKHQTGQAKLSVTFQPRINRAHLYYL